jgi:hypothetical protein
MIAPAAFALALTLTTASRADDALPRVRLDLHGCDASMTTEVRRIAEVELRAVVIDAASQREAATHVVITCREDALVDLFVSDEATAKQLERTVRLTETAARAQARLLALAAAELVRASWEELESNPKPEVPAATPPPAKIVTAVRHAVEGPPTVIADAAADGRIIGPQKMLLYGAGVRARVALAGPVFLRVDALFDFGSLSRKTGRVSAEAFSGGASGAWGFDWNLLYGFAWVGFRGTYVRLLGAPEPGTTGHTLRGGLFGAEIGFDMVLRPRSSPLFTLGVSGGYAVVGVHGTVDGESPVDLKGPWAALSLGVGLSKR